MLLQRNARIARGLRSHRLAALQQLACGKMILRRVYALYAREALPHVVQYRKAVRRRAVSPMADTFSRHKASHLQTQVALVRPEPGQRAVRLQFSSNGRGGRARL